MPVKQNTGLGKNLDHFSTLHDASMQGSLSHEPNVCPSVRPSVCQKRVNSENPKETYAKIFIPNMFLSSSFLRRMVGGAPST